MVREGSHQIHLSRECGLVKRDLDGYIGLSSFTGIELKFTEERLDQIFDGIRRSSVVVVGDLMLDRYVWGVVERISPEAPVPIVNLSGESSNLGGAANVAANVASLGASVKLIGVVGDDSDGVTSRDLIRRSGINDEGIISDPSRPTSIKTRVIAHNQHVARIDHESVAPIPAAIEDLLISRFSDSLVDTQVVILEDYNKGVLTPRVISSIIAECKKRGIKVGVDPKLDNFWDFRGASVLKPNLKELESALGRRVPDVDDGQLASAGREVMRRLELDCLLVTMGERGMALFQKDDPKVELIPTRAHRVHDVSGAGDTVIATMMSALAGGADVWEAAYLANFAASVVIAEIGAVPIDAGELRRVSLGR